MKKIQLFLIVLLVGIQATMAQSVQVSGKVTYADDGAPVIGATINVKGTSVATLSDVNGEYKLTIPTKDSKIIVVTYTGLLTQEIQTPTSGVYNVVLATDALNADEVVVTGYGNVSRKNYAGAAAVVSTAALKDVPSVSVADRLAGNVAGLTVTSTSGQPGSAESIRIRGMGSINAGNSPLVVVDGVPITTGSASTFSYAEAGNSMLATINPADIESMTVIKDAAAASLYGSRAANGVVVITTKRGSAGKTRFNVKANVGFSDMAVNWRPTLGGAARKEVLHLGLVNQGLYEKNMTEAQAKAYADTQLGTSADAPWSGYTDWRKLIFRQGLNQNYEISAQGGNEKTKFYTSLGYTDTKGITQNQGYSRISGNINLEHKSGIFTLNASSRFSSIAQEVNSEGGSYSSPFMFTAATGSPTDYPYNQDGSINTTVGFVGIRNALANPIWNRELNYDKSNITRSMNMISGQLDLFKGFAIKETLSYDFNYIENEVWWDPRSNDGRTAKGVMQKYNMTMNTLTSQTMASYNRLFADVHSLSVLAAFEIEDYKQSEFYASGTGYPTYKKPEIANASVQSSSTYLSSSALMSVVAKADYTYDNRIYVGASFRRDGSSRLSPETRWGNFWSASAFWRISNEKWFKDGGVSRVLTDARIRASYGENGTQPAEYYKWIGTYAFGYNYAGSPGSAENLIPNPELRWEKNMSTNFGIDLTFIDRITLGIELYNRDTKDLIMEEPISQTTGFATTLKNIGSMNNKGIEFEISALAIQTKDINWTIKLNMSHNKNKIVKLGEDQDEILDGNWNHRIGHSYYSFWTREYAGVDPATGLESYYKNTQNADGTINREVTTDYTKVQRIIYDNVDPVVAGGLSSNFSYKWLDFGFTFTYSLGGHALNSDNIGNGNGSTSNYNGQLPEYYQIDQMWKKPGDIASLPKFQAGSIGAIGSSRYIVSTDYLRLKNITLGFSAPKSWLKKLTIEKLRIYASASNLFTIKDKACTFDPEVPIGAVVSYQAPQLRMVNFGLEIGF